METTLFFDHMEAHVSDIPRYCDFLVKLFRGGRWKTIGDNGTAMFISSDGLRIEIKQKKEGVMPTAAGFCNPCVRTENARELVEKELGLEITQTVKAAEGDVYFFVDHECVTWHVKDFLKQDISTNW